MNQLDAVSRVRAGSPLWEAVRDDLLERVRSGEFSDSFPGEISLAGEYGVSRGTIRAALRPLRESGVVSAHRGQRPRIVVDQAPGSFGPVYSLFEAVTAAGFSQRSRVISQGFTRNAHAAGQLERPDDEMLFELVRLRLADDSPLAVDRIWLPSEIGEALLDVDFSETALYRQLAKKCGISLDGGSEELRAETADAGLARQLQCAPGTTLFRIDRIAWSRGRAIEFRRTCVIADRYVARTSFGEPRSAAGTARDEKTPAAGESEPGFRTPPGT
ncbi:MAG: GntR family transcriptional regulator [Microcella sp.]|mgnify:CR=1 FL=1|uniref:GntR family transcriptional regulator n=1 Tax=Microcella sp. TaxID=1913979 RepID=UPI00272916B8|nr:GntR family transcriptional regulator [Microcella sp.]MDO8337073.1 GntR family transcriptional regulator [Microcella sp.]